jgi:hypothetical protein
VRPAWPGERVRCSRPQLVDPEGDPAVDSTQHANEPHYRGLHGCHLSEEAFLDRVQVRSGHLGDLRPWRPHAEAILWIPIAKEERPGRTRDTKLAGNGREV